MNRAMIAAASGMSIEEHNLEQVSENVANSDTPGYKSSEAWFSALASGLGGTYGGTRLNMSQGKLEKSGGPFDLAITGPGFFPVTSPSGETAYTRVGDFRRTSDGHMINGQGCQLQGVVIPSNVNDLTVDLNGRILATQNGLKNQVIGRVNIVTFPAPDQLRQANVKATFYATPASGNAHALAPGSETKISFGMLERSNASIIESMLGLLAAQRAYEANSKGVQSADEILRIANSLQKS